MIEDPSDVIGVDLGTVDIAVDSTGKRYTGKKYRM